MKSGSWSSFVAAGALGDGGGPDDDGPAEGPGAIPDPTESLRGRGYRGFRDAATGRWTVAIPDPATGLPSGEPIGAGATAVEAWDAALRREAEEFTRIHRGLDEHAGD